MSRKWLEEEVIEIFESRGFKTVGVFKDSKQYLALFGFEKKWLIVLFKSTELKIEKKLYIIIQVFKIFIPFILSLMFSNPSLSSIFRKNVENKWNKILGL